MKRVDAKWDYGEAKTAFFFSCFFTCLHWLIATTWNWLTLPSKVMKTMESQLRSQYNLFLIMNSRHNSALLSCRQIQILLFFSNIFHIQVPDWDISKNSIFYVKFPSPDPAFWQNQTFFSFLQHANATSSGYFISQDLAHGNLILPVLPRFESDQWWEHETLAKQVELSWNIDLKWLTFDVK